GGRPRTNEVAAGGVLRTTGQPSGDPVTWVEGERSQSPGGALGPHVEFRWLDTLWIQVAGTLCNIACRHCFISCGPKAHELPMMTLEQVQHALDEGCALGVRHVYFTGGEPFLHPDIRRLVEMALEAAALTVVTNGLLLDDETVQWL